MSQYVLRAEFRAFPLWTTEGENIAPDSLPLSSRLLSALEDWSGFFDDVGGEIGDRDVMDEFVGQGFKIAHVLRRELKGQIVWFHHPSSGELIRIENRTPS